jgi:hypothetical protein
MHSVQRQPPTPPFWVPFRPTQMLAGEVPANFFKT